MNRLAHFKVVQISTEQTRPLRHQVLWPHLKQESECTIPGETASDVIHLGVYLNEKLICIGSLFPQSTEKLSHTTQYRLRAMATDPAYRAQQAGKCLVEYALALLHSMNIEVLWCDARIHATGFYLALGFNRMDDVYMIPLIGPHQFMWIELSGTQA